MFSWRVEKKEVIYDQLLEWWKKHDFPAIAVNALPSNLFVVSDKKQDLYVIPVYFTDSSLFWTGFITSNPNADKREKQGALDWLMEKVETALKFSKPESTIITTSGNPFLIKTMKERGYKENIENVNYYIKNL